MTRVGAIPRFRGIFSLDPLITFWKDTLLPANSSWLGAWEFVSKELERRPFLTGPIEDITILADYKEIVETLMSAVFPMAYWETEIAGAMVPFKMQPVHISPRFQRFFFNPDGTSRGRLRVDERVAPASRSIGGYLLILKSLYGIEKEFEYPLVRIIEDSNTGLQKRFRFRPDLRFVNVVTIGEIPKLTDDQLTSLAENFTSLDALTQLLPPENFEFHGFTVIRAEDVTQVEILSELERSLIDKDSIFSQVGLQRLEHQLRTIFRVPDLTGGIGAIQGENVLLLGTNCDSSCECIFAGSLHIPVREFEGSLFHQAVRERRIIRMRDLEWDPQTGPIEREFLRNGMRSMLIAPLMFQNEPIGILLLGSKESGRFGPKEELLAAQMTPLFTMALTRALDELDNRVQRIIKEQCTAVHPAVEWKFRNHVYRRLEKLQHGENTELEPIVFKDVYPFYGAADVRGSSETRNRAIIEDLASHIDLAIGILKRAIPINSLDIFHELAHRLELALRNLVNGQGPSEEVSAIYLLRKEVEPLFGFLRNMAEDVAAGVDEYEREMDPGLRTVYRKRKEFEKSIATINDRLAAYLDLEEAEMQAVFPHYFSKHQTDGLDYIIYAGASMLENGVFNELFLKNLRLRQMIAACGMAWHAEEIRPQLKAPLDVTHLILINQSPMSIRFRFDEKRFDADGAYDTGHFIIRSRIDKATIKGTGERLTQPGKVAIVYSRIQEADEIRRHIDFLISRKFFTDEVENAELEDLSGVQGLRAFRAGINMDSPALAEYCRKQGLGG